MENKENTCTTCTTGSCGCKCGSMMGMGGHKHHILRKILMLILLVIVFNLGMRMGELKGLLQSQNNSYHRGGMMMNYGTTPIMMGGGYTQ